MSKRHAASLSGKIRVMYDPLAPLAPTHKRYRKVGVRLTREPMSKPVEARKGVLAVRMIAAIQGRKAAVAAIRGATAYKPPMTDAEIDAKWENLLAEQGLMAAADDWRDDQRINREERGL